MIIIFSTAEDFSTTDVMQWLHHWGVKDVVRINAEDTNAVIDVREGDFCIQVANRTIRLHDIKAVWYRKGSEWLCTHFPVFSLEDHPRFSEFITRKLKAEGRKLSEYLHFLIERSLRTLGNPEKSDLNKLQVLSIARGVGLLIPDFYIINRKEGAEKLLKTPEMYITKAMSDGVYMFENRERNTGYFSYTEQLSEEMLANVPSELMPSFIQKGVDKDFEVRTFFLDGVCYSMAIFSQGDEQTKIDFRKYNEEKPNRMVPYTLPKETDQKIGRLFERLGMRTGSVDLLVDKKGDFYFLEINPVGQFGMVSQPCNYFLEKKVALTLVEDAQRTAS